MVLTCIFSTKGLLGMPKNTKASGTLMIPQWLSAPFWPLLFPNGSDPTEFVLVWLELPTTAELILPGLSGANLFQIQQC